MLPSELTVELSRAQFGVTALYHFLFVPLTLGLSWILVIMEAAYLKTGKQVYKDMVKFWGKLFAINFAMGVVTGITMEFEFGQNWAYFSRFIGDTFGTSLAIEGITAFMTEATMFGLFFFTWDKVSPRVHWLITIVMAFGTNLSIVNILVANSWMQHPIATVFDYHTMDMHLTSFVQIYGAQLAQVRVGHIAFGAFVVSSMFVMGVSSYYLLKKQDIGFALRSYAVAVGFGLSAACFTFFLGDANGLAVAKQEPMKMAAIEGQWTTQTAPAAWFVTGFPNNETQSNGPFVIKIPYMLSLIADHNLTSTVEGILPQEQANKQKIRDGAKAYQALENLRSGKGSAADEATFKKYKHVLGFGLLLKHFTDNPMDATPAQIDKAALLTKPPVWPVFWGFRLMMACWAVVTLIMILGTIFLWRWTLIKQRWLLKAALFAIPLPYLAAEFGWVVAEVGRQPWTVHGFLPTFVSSSSLAWQTVLFSLIGFSVFYTILLVIELFLMFKYGRMGPSSLGEGRYHFETIDK